jgi:Spy/CpxP family protein refolding chaperone
LNPFTKRAAVTAGLFCLSAAAGLTGAQSSRPTAVQTPPMVSPAARPKRDTPPTDYFAGLTLTADQKAKIDAVHQKTKSRLDAVVKDEKLDADQKAAMLLGYRRMENGQIFNLLTPEQRIVVRERIRAQRLAGREEEKKKQSLPK